nr:hypothetical protein [Bradyrhizobium sp. WSM1417]
MAAAIGRHQRQSCHAFAHLNREISEMQLGPFQLLDEYPREHRIMSRVVATELVERGLADPRRIECEYPARGPGISEPSCVPDRTTRGARKRIVTTGIDDNEGHAHRLRLELRDQIGLRD